MKESYSFLGLVKIVDQSKIENSVNKSTLKDLDNRLLAVDKRIAKIHDSLVQTIQGPGYSSFTGAVPACFRVRNTN